MIRLLTKREETGIIKKLRLLMGYESKSWRPDDSYYEYENPGVGNWEDFPACCGATVLAGFDFQESDQKMDNAGRLLFKYYLNRRLSENTSPMIVVILNDHQEKTFGDILRDFGGEQLGKPVMGRQRNLLYLYVFTQRQRKSRKRVF